MTDPSRGRAPESLRSARWFAPDDLRSFGHRSRMLQMGYAPADFIGRPIIGILNTWSDLNPCHSHFKSRVEDVKRGVLQAGGFPVEMPAIALSETFMKPTTMLYRNLLAMEAEEQIRAHPVDGVVLMGGCDKTTPALIMGALSAGLPMIFLPAGPMLRGNYAGQTLGSGSDVWKFWDERRAGNISERQWLGIEAGIARSYGHCMTMGTASTMTAIADAMGLTLPGADAILEILHWREPQELFDLAHFIAATRPGYDLAHFEEDAASSLRSEVTVMHVPALAISSTTSAHASPMVTRSVTLCPRGSRATWEKAGLYRERRVPATGLGLEVGEVPA